VTAVTDPRCGTDAGYQAHQVAGEPPCDPCRDAHTVKQRRWRKLNPAARDRQRFAIRTRNRALERLAVEYRPRFPELLAEERSR
jgi:hypothetical protein